MCEQTDKWVASCGVDLQNYIHMINIKKRQQIKKKTKKRKEGKKERKQTNKKTSPIKFCLCDNHFFHCLLKHFYLKPSFPIDAL